MLVVASRGQQALVPFWIQWTDGSGQNVDPDVPPALEIFKQSGGTLVTVSTLTPTKLTSHDGFYGTSVSVSNTTTWPAGTYVALWTATIDGVVTSTTDTFQIYDAADSMGSGALGSAYCSEADIRSVTKVLTELIPFTSLLVATHAAVGAGYIDGKLGGRFTVPFTSPYPTLIAILNMWESAATLLEYASSEKGNQNPFAAELHERVDACIADILEGKADIGIEPKPEAGTGRIKSSTFGMNSDFTRSIPRKSRDLARF